MGTSPLTRVGPCNDETSAERLIDAGDLLIMTLVSRGITTRDIGRQLGQTSGHVRRRIGAVQHRLDAPTKIAAVVKLVRLGLV